MKNSNVLWGLVIATVILGLFVFTSFTGNVIAPTSGEVRVVDNKIIFSNIESVENNALVLLSLSKDRKILATTTVNFGELVDANFTLSSIFDNFSYESGTYELFVQIPSLDLIEITSFQQ